MFKNNLTFAASESMGQEKNESDNWQRRRQEAEEWLETHYDLNSADGIRSIPERSDPVRPSFAYNDGFKDYTYDIDYYLRVKSRQFEESGDIHLAVLCLKKSNAIRMLSRRGYRRDDYYALVELLAENGFIAEAEDEKRKIDVFFGKDDVDSIVVSEPIVIKQIYDDMRRSNTDLVIMSVHGASCSDCAKYQGRVFSVTGKNSLFPKLPSSVSLYRGIHPGCGHTFSAYIHGITNPMLDYTLTFQNNVKPEYKGDIVSFSNRPFVDDRLPEDIEKAREYANKMDAERKKRQYYYDHVIEIAAQRGIDKRDYKWLQDSLPAICPKSYSGYKRMKNGNTKNYQRLVAKAKELGRNI